MKKTKKVCKVTALAALLSVVTCGNSAWAVGMDITLSSSGVSSTIYGGGKGDEDYGYYNIWGVSGTRELATNVNSIVTDGELSNGTCYGIWLKKGDSVSATSIAGGINLKSKCDVTGIVLDDGSGDAQTYAKVNIANMGNIILESTESTAWGIYANNLNSDAQSVTFSVSFAEDAGIIKAYYNSNLGYGYGIVFGEDNAVTGISEVKNVKTIEVGANPDVSNAKTNGHYGISAWGGKNTVTFTGGDSSIVLRSGTVAGYYQCGISLAGGEDTAENTITGLGKIEVTGCSDSDGIYISAATNKIEFAGTGSSITVNSTGGEVYGIGFGYDDDDTNYCATGTTKISELGSITVETTSEDSDSAYGIFAYNYNGASEDAGDDASFSVSFATEGVNDGKVKVYSENGYNYGIYFSYYCTGTSEIKNVKTIEVGYRNNGDTEEVTSSDAYGIYLYGGTYNKVQFVDAGGFINVKSQGDGGYAFGIYTEDTNSTVSNINELIVAGIGAASAYGVYAQAYGTENTITFVGEESSVIVTSDSGSASGMELLCDGITVSGLEKISATGARAHGLIAKYASNVTFTGADSSITAKSTGNEEGDNSYGINLRWGTSGVTISNLGSITATTECKDNNAYGIYVSEGSEDCEYEISFTGGSVIKQAITATVSTAGGTGKAYSIYATTDGDSEEGDTYSCSTTVNFEKTILSGKIYNKAATTGAGTETTELTLNFKDGSIWVPVDGDVEGDVDVNVKNKATIYTGDNGTTDSINLGNGTLTFEDGSQIKIDVLVTATTLTIDNFTVGKATGVVTLGDVEIYDDAATTVLVEKNLYLIKGDCSGITNYTLGTGLNEIDTGNYKYTISMFKDTTGLGLKIIMSDLGGLAYEISGGSSNMFYELESDEKLTEKLGILNNTNRAYFIMDGKGYTLDANAQEGVTIESLVKSAKNIMKVKNITIKGFETFATNSGSLTLEGGDGSTGGITFTGTTGTADVVNTATGILGVKGTVGLCKGISNAGTVNLTDVIFTGTTSDADITNSETGIVNVNGAVTLNKGINNANKIEITRDGTIFKGDEIKGTGTLYFKENGEIDFNKISNKMDIAPGKTVILGSSVEKTTEVNSESIEIDEGGELEIKSTGTGKVVMGDKVKINGRGNSKFRVKAGSFLEYKNRTPKSIKAAAGKVLDIFIEKNSTFDPCVSVFAENVNVNVAEDGTLVLTPGTLYANIKQDAGSIIEIKAADVDFNNTPETPLFADVKAAEQLDISVGKLAFTDNVQKWHIYTLVEGDAVADKTLTASDLWKIDNVDDAAGTLSSGALLGEYVSVGDAGIGLEIRNVPTAVEANTSALAGVQQGAAAMVNQLNDKVADNLTLIQRPVADGKYDKQVWASYINGKETMDDRNLWQLQENNTANYRGTIVGADFYTSDKVIAGVAISYAKGDISANTIDSTHVQNDSKYYGVSFYDRVTNGSVALTYDIGYQYGKNDISMSARENITADVDTQAYTAGVRVERAYKVNGTSTFAPFASLRYLRLHTKEYNNSNQAKFDSNNQNLFIPKLGVAWQGNYVNEKSGWAFKPVAEVGYIFNLGNRSVDGKFTTTTSRVMNPEYDVVDSGTFYGKLGFRVANKNFFVGADYNYLKGSTTKNNRWNINLGWSF